MTTWSHSLDIINTFLQLEQILKEKHFAYKIISKMLISPPNARPNLREIILSFLSLQNMIRMKAMLNKEDGNKNMEQVQYKSSAVLPL